MKPLLYVSYKTVYNGIKRTVRTPTRLIGAIAIIAYWMMLIITRGFGGGRELPKGFGAPQFNLPASDLLFAIAFAAFLGVFYFRSLSMFSPPGRYKASDADVLFPTPVNPKYVMIHRFLSDYLITLFIPLLIYFLVRRTSGRGLGHMVSGIDKTPGIENIGTTTFLAFLFISLFAVAVSYAVGMAINRDTKTAIRAKRYVSWLVTLVFAGIAVLVFRAVFEDDPARALVETANSPTTRLALLPVTAAAEFAIAPLRGGAGLTWGIGLVLGSLVLFAVALSQSSHLYDMASRRSIPAGQAREAARSGDLSAQWVRMAREGKLGRRKVPLISKFWMPHVWALVWRDLVLQYRIFLWIFLPVSALLVIAAWLPLFDAAARNALWLSFVFMILGTLPFMVPAMTQSGFQESLRRVDVLKPLPFSMTQICMFEAIGKSVGAMITVLVGALIMLGLRPEKWQEAIAVLIGLLPVCVLSSSISWISSLLFPDLADPSQRFLRGITMIAGFAVVYLPGSLIVFGGMALHIPVLILGVLLAVLTSCLSYLGAKVAAPLLTRYNPAD